MIKTSYSSETGAEVRVISGELFSGLKLDLVPFEICLVVGMVLFLECI